MQRLRTYLRLILFICITIALAKPCFAYPLVETDRPTLLKVADTFTQNIKANPTNAINYFNRGTIYLRLGDDHQAESDLARAAAIDSTLAIAYNNRAIIHLQNGSHSTALNLLNQAISLQPDLSDAYVNRGIIKFNSGQYEEALSDFNRAISLAPSCAQAFANRGILSACKDNLPAAAKDFDTAISLNPYIPPFFYNRAILNQTQKKDDKALSDLSRVINIPIFFYNYADLDSSHKKDDEALSNLNCTIEKQAQTNAYYHLGQIAINLANYDQAAYAFDTAVSLGLNLTAAKLNNGYLLYPALSSTQIEPFKQIVSIDYAFFHPFGGDYSFNIELAPNQGIYVYRLKSKSAEVGNYYVPAKNIAAFAKALMALHPEEWPSYYPPFATDEPSWHFTVRFIDGKTVGFSGHDRPPYYRELENFIGEYLRAANIEKCA